MAGRLDAVAMAVAKLRLGRRGPDQAPVRYPASWLADVAGKARAEHDVAARQLLAAEPGLTADQAAAKLEPAPAPTVAVVDLAQGRLNTARARARQLASPEWAMAPDELRQALVDEFGRDAALLDAAFDAAGVEPAAVAVS
jgi:hypothetical protein